MNDYDLRLAFHRHLIALELDDIYTARPDEIYKPEELGTDKSWRRGTVLVSRPEIIAFGHGIYSKLSGIYQIDIYVPRAIQNALRRLSETTDAHVDAFFPKNGRGHTLVEKDTMAHITRRPGYRHLGRDAAYLRAIVEVYFYVHIHKED